MGKLNLSPEEINSLYPIVGVRVRKRGLQVVRQSLMERVGKGGGSRRPIELLSRRSLSNFAYKVGNAPISFTSLLTLTYGQNFAQDGKTAKRGLASVLQALRRRFSGVKYFWFLEFQERGAPHFHVGLSISPTTEDRSWLAKLWGGIAEPGNFAYVPGWGPGFGEQSPVEYTRDAVITQHLREGVWEDVKNQDGAIRYVTCYALKPHQKLVPEQFSNVGRFWGLSRGLGDGDFVDFLATESQVREMCSALGRNMDKFDVLPKFIFHSGKLPEQEFDNISLF